MMQDQPAGASIFTKEDFDQDASGADTIQAVDWGKAHVATKVDGVVNILLVGQDTRGEQRQRSDSMIILSINKNTKQMTMVSVMRDLYVQIPGYSDNRHQLRLRLRRLRAAGCHH